MKLYWRYENQVWTGYTRYAEPRAVVKSVMGDLLWNRVYVNDQCQAEFSSEKDAMIDAESRIEEDEDSEAICYIPTDSFSSPEMAHAFADQLKSLGYRTWFEDKDHREGDKRPEDPDTVMVVYGNPLK